MSSKYLLETRRCAINLENESLSLQASLSLNNNENFKEILSLIAMEFESQKEYFKKFNSEKEFLNSNQLKSFISDLKKYIVCWAARPDCLSWLDAYITSILVGHWRALSDESSKHTPGSSGESVRKADQEPEVNTTSEKKITSEPFELMKTPQIAPQPQIYRSITLTMELINFQLICRNSDGDKIVEPDLELAAASCLAPCRASQTQSRNYSWETFLQKFQQLLEEQVPREAAYLCHGTVGYFHPDKRMRIIRNQEQFVVALNHLFYSIRGCTISLYYSAPREKIKTEEFEIEGKDKIDGFTAKVACFGENVVPETVGQNEGKHARNFDEIFSPLNSQIPVPNKIDLKRRPYNSPLTGSRVNTKSRNSLIASRNARGIYRRKSINAGYRLRVSNLRSEKSDANFSKDMAQNMHF